MMEHFLSRHYPDDSNHERRNAGFQPARSAGFQPARTGSSFGERCRGNWQAGKPADRASWKLAFRTVGAPPFESRLSREAHPLSAGTQASSLRGQRASSLHEPAHLLVSDAAETGRLGSLPTAQAGSLRSVPVGAPPFESRLSREAHPLSAGTQASSLRGQRASSLQEPAHLLVSDAAETGRLGSLPTAQAGSLRSVPVGAPPFELRLSREAHPLSAGTQASSLRGRPASSLHEPAHLLVSDAAETGRLGSLPTAQAGSLRSVPVGAPPFESRLSREAHPLSAGTQASSLRGRRASSLHEPAHLLVSDAAETGRLGSLPTAQAGSLRSVPVGAPPFELRLSREAHPLSAGTQASSLRGRRASSLHEPAHLLVSDAAETGRLGSLPTAQAGSLRSVPVGAPPFE